MRESRKRKIKLVGAKYQPTRAELEKDLRPRNAGTVTEKEFTQMVGQLVQPVKVAWKEKP